MEPIKPNQRGNVESAEHEIQAPVYDHKAFRQLLEHGRAFAKQPCHAKTPFLVCGPTPSGKTHFLEWFARQFNRYHASWNTLIIPAAEFRAEVGSMLASNRIGEFRQQYWRLDAFLLDDFDELITNHASLVELYHLFNRMLADGKPIVMTCRVVPEKMVGLSPELKHRLESGSVHSLPELSIASKRWLIAQRLRLAGFQVNRPTLSYLTRELKQIYLTDELVRLARQLGHTGRLPSPVVREIVEQHFQPKFTAEQVTQLVAKELLVPIEEIVSSSRAAEIVRARKLAMYLIRDLTGQPLVEIGKYFGGRDHTTVMYALRTIETELAQDGGLQSQADAIRFSLLSGPE